MSECERVTFEHRHENKTGSACRERVNERMRECPSVRLRECESERVTFEHRHENNCCSACPEDQLEQFKF